MLAWLEAQGHWGFITVSYLLFFLVLLADFLPPWMRERRLRREILQRLKRQRATGKDV